MSIESLKQQARRHEQNEEWQKALDQYSRALAELAQDEQVDIGLYNRVGDLYVRTGDLNSAFQHYDKCVDLYREAYLPNNAIAVCKKIIRNMPNRHAAYLRIGQIRAEQGFLPEARDNFLTYAERMQKQGDLDESFRALIEFCDLAPDDVGVRITVAEQMATSGRKKEAVEQFKVARRRFAQGGDQAQASALERKILALDPNADLSGLPIEADAFAVGATDDDFLGGFGDISMTADDDVARPRTPAPRPKAPTAQPPAPAPEEDRAFEITTGAGRGVDEGAFGEDDAEPAAELPMMAFGEEAAEDLGADLPIMAFDDEPAGEEAAELPMMAFDDESAEEEAAELPLMAFDDESGGEEAAEPPRPRQPSAAPAVQEAIEEARPRDRPAAEPEPQPRRPAEPAPATDYVDLGAMIFGTGEAKSTRLTVAYEEPTGDEDADFAKMLSQFKAKISENLDSSDVRAHYDLGTAYKEMGLLDEAISSFQAALRASPEHLPTYEVMGQTFIEMGKPEAAVKSLQRALQSRSGVEDERVGIYYYLARAYEALEDRSSAVEFYDRVFSLDINFADVTDRLKALR